MCVVFTPFTIYLAAEQIWNLLVEEKVKKRDETLEFWKKENSITDFY